jgi:hypothetical protein
MGIGERRPAEGAHHEHVGVTSTQKQELLHA